MEILKRDAYVYGFIYTVKRKRIERNHVLNIYNIILFPGIYNFTSGFHKTKKKKILMYLLVIKLYVKLLN